MKIPARLGALAVVLWSASASAHIDASAPAPRHAGPYTAMKDGPCGVAGSARGATVHTFQPGEIITITINETIPHPGYMRIAFDADGDDGFVPPRSIDPSLEQPSGGRACVADADLDPFVAGDKDNCGQPDFCHNDTVLLDNLDAVAVGQGGTHTFQVKLPATECDNCTLQVIQVMTDIPGHGYHDPTNPATGNIYYECIDIALVSQGSDPSSFGEQPATGGATGIRCGMDALPDNNLEPMGGSTTPEPTDPDPGTDMMNGTDTGTAGMGSESPTEPTPTTPAEGTTGAPVTGTDTPMPGDTTTAGDPTANPVPPTTPQPMQTSSGGSDSSGCAAGGSGAPQLWLLLPALGLLLLRRRRQR